MPAPGCDPPPDLNGEALAEWNRIAPELLALGLLTRIDRAALHAYAVEHARWLDAEKHVAEHGSVVMTSTGAAIISPWLSVARGARQAMVKIMAEFGMTPSSRARVTATKTPEEDEFERWNNENGKARFFSPRVRAMREA